MTVPQVLADLPYADFLEPFDRALARGGDYRELLFADAEFVDFEADNSDLGESAFTRVSFTNGGFRRSRLHDVWFAHTRWIRANLAETEWLDAQVLDSVFAGVEAHGARLRRVTFQECKIDTWNLRGADIRDVVFDRCELTEVDLSEATLANVTFTGSALRRIRFDKATMKNVDFRGASSLEVASGCESMRGALIDSVQLTDLAPTLARTLGIVVKDR